MVTKYDPTLYGSRFSTLEAVMTLREVADALGICWQNVQQTERRAFRKIYAGVLADPMLRGVAEERGWLESGDG